MEKANDNTLIIKVDAYLKGHLSAQESTAFAQEIAADKDLAAQVERQKVHLEALDILLEDDLRAKMTIWASENDENQNNRTRKPWVFGLMGVFALIGLFFLLKPKNQVEQSASEPSKSRTNDSLSSDKNRPLKNEIDTLQIKPNSTSPTQKSTPSVSKPQKPIAEVQTLPNEVLAAANDDIALVISELENNAFKRGKESDTSLSASYRSIRQKDYAKALNTLKNISNTEGVFARAMTYFLDGQFAKAWPLFETLAQNTGFDRSEMAEYYATLCLLANGQKAEAINRLKKIADDKGHQYESQAKKVIKAF